MRTRNAGYKNYGMSKEEANSLMEFCQSPQFCEHELLIKCAEESYQDIAPDLYYSLARGISYDDITKIRYIPLSRSDFYGYRRKCLDVFRRYLVFTGKGYRHRNEPVNLLEEEYP